MLLLKGKPSLYHSLCMLDTVGKILEWLICNKLIALAKTGGGGNLSEHQFGLRKGRSTINAVRMVVDTAWKAIEGERPEEVLCGGESGHQACI